MAKIAVFVSYYVEVDVPEDLLLDDDELYDYLSDIEGDGNLFVEGERTALDWEVLL